MKLNFFSNAQRDRILFMISLPQKPEFMIHSASVVRCTNQIRKMGVEVIEQINAEILSHANQYDVVIVVAHLDERRNELELSDSVMPLDEFVSDLPKDFSGTLDFSSCNSSIVFEKIKKQCPNCTVKAANEEVGLNLRLTVYPSFIKRLLKKCKKTYDQIYEDELKKAEYFYNRIHSDRATDVQRSQKLGKGKSAIFVPVQVAKSKPFQVIVKLLQDEADETMSFKSLSLDSSGNAQVHLTNIPVKTGDRISARLQFVSGENELIHLQNEQDSFKLDWQGRMCEKTFQAVIDLDYTKPFIFGRLTISINEKEIGDCLFLTKVATDSNGSSLDVPLILYQAGQAHSKVKTIMNAYLEHQIVSLKYRLTKTKDKEKRSAIDIDINNIENLRFESNRFYG